MKIENKLHKWVIGAVMGKSFVKSYNEKEEDELPQKQASDSLQGFIKLGLSELKQNIKKTKKRKTLN